jgi:hypothetical protein
MPSTISEWVQLISVTVDTQVDSVKFLDLWLSCALQHCVEPGTLAQNWMMGQQTAYNDAVELAVATARI